MSYPYFLALAASGDADPQMLALVERFERLFDPAAPTPKPCAVLLTTAERDVIYDAWRGEVRRRRAVAEAT